MSSTSSLTEPLDLARTLPRYYRGEPPEPGYLAAIAQVLAGYPAEVRRTVCSPTGIPSRCKFFPTLAEIRDACEIEMAPLWRQEARRRTRTLALEAPAETTPEARERAVAAWEEQRKDMTSGEDREAREKAETVRAVQMVAISDRLRDRELARAGIIDGKPIGLELRKKLEAIGARFDLSGGMDNHPSNEV